MNRVLARETLPDLVRNLRQSFSEDAQCVTFLSRVPLPFKVRKYVDFIWNPPK